MYDRRDIVHRLPDIVDSMPLAQTATRVVADRLPKVIGPKAHAIADYSVVGIFLLMGAAFWGRNKRAAIAALACGGATAATSLVTDYPGGVKRVINYRTHGRIDAGLAGLAAAMPNFLAFQDEREAKFFRTMALAETVITGLTDYDAAISKVIEMPRRRA
jgi:hypothetical protein